LYFESVYLNTLAPICEYDKISRCTQEGERKRRVRFEKLGHKNAIKHKRRDHA
jgi:hypothetical protein